MPLLLCWPESLPLLYLAGIPVKGKESNHVWSVMGWLRALWLVPAKRLEQKLSATQIQGFYNPPKHKGVSCSGLCSPGLFCLSISEKPELIRRGFARLFESLRSSSTNRQEGNSAEASPCRLWVLGRVVCLCEGEQAKGAALRAGKYPGNVWSLQMSSCVCLVHSKCGHPWGKQDIPPEMGINPNSAQDILWAEGRLLKISFWGCQSVGNRLGSWAIFKQTDFKTRSHWVFYPELNTGHFSLCFSSSSFSKHLIWKLWCIWLLCIFENQVIMLPQLSRKLSVIWKFSILNIILFLYIRAFWSCQIIFSHLQSVKKAPILISCCGINF